MVQATRSGRSQCRTAPAIPISRNEMCEGLRIWATLAEEIEGQLNLTKQDVLSWTIEKDGSQKQLSFWAKIEWLFNGVTVAQIHGVIVCDHQIHPDNIVAYAKLIADKLKSCHRRIAGFA